MTRSAPAVFGVTQHAYIVFAANAFALLGLRPLYFLVSGLLDRLVYQSTGLAVIGLVLAITSGASLLAVRRSPRRRAHAGALRAGHERVE